ncbi:hypothetical protein J2S00_002269 [Caldalkalibacillus uzonensis]|uniref:Uncharacterized protein n=1 Tax=Caldalkalibacillus uzonensis TaxID=353224 RepID=A0ABU0CU89_9BACI|nr:hypothetical protein [Caldalkalibacillus uzonensis]MDQ0339481.1 hypothetical protein [Caldalkalibacillus uzonensis]
MTRLLFTSPEVEAVSQAYHFHVYQAQRTADGYDLETDCGSKSVTEIKDPDALKWSYHWREAVVKRGFRQVDRFILTRDKTAYLSTQSSYLVVRDRLAGEPVDFSRSEAWQALGTSTALIHCALEDTAKLKLGLGAVDTPSAFMSPGELARLKHKLKKKRSAVASLLVKQWPLLYKRYLVARKLYRKSQPVLSQMLSLPVLDYSFWKMVGGGCLAFEGPLDKPVLGFQALSKLIQELWLRFGIDEEQLVLFFTAFEHDYQPSVYVFYHMLAHLVYPEQLLTFIQGYVEQQEEGTAAQDEWEQMVTQQEKLDRLHIWLAERIDQMREDLGGHVAD